MTADPHRHILINGLSIGSGGGYTVGRMLLEYIALARPEWTVTMALSRGVKLHEEIEGEALPANCKVHWAPPETARTLRRVQYETLTLPGWARAENIAAVLQLNGMLIPTLRRPTLCHNQDPMPYRPEAWEGRRDRYVSIFKRRAQARGLRKAAFVGWTSAYLRDLMCGWLGITPRHGEVFYNGIPEGWIARAGRPLDDLGARPLEIVTISNVAPYKRQSLVIEALPRLVANPRLAKLTYRVIGDCSPARKDDLLALAARLGVGERVVIEGRVSTERVQEAFAQARCYVLMSLCESFGIPAIEAMSFGTPVVTSDCGAMPEVCGDAAELSPVDDVVELARRLERVLLDRDHADAMRTRGARQVTRFAWPDTAARMADRLEMIAATRA